MTIAVIIPCFNVGRHIEKVLRSIPLNADYIIAVNDASTDNTGEILKQLQPEIPRLVYIEHEKNKGVGGAMITGYKRSIELNADISVKIDGDGQMDASLIGNLVRPILEDKADFTKGNRFRDLRALRQMPLVRRFGNLGLSFLIKAASGYWNIFDPTNGFTAVRNETLKNFNFRKIHPRYFFETSMLIEAYHANAVVQDVPMKAIYGDEKSGLSITKTLFEFPPKLFLAFLKRIILKYFLYEFNIASIYILVGFPLFIIGTIFGILNYIRYGSMHVQAPTGTVVIPTLLIILGFQLILSAIQFDSINYPRK